MTTKFPVPMQILSKNLESEEIEMEDDGWNDDSSANLNINAINLKEIALDQDLDLTLEEVEQIKLLDEGSPFILQNTMRRKSNKIVRFQSNSSEISEESTTDMDMDQTLIFNHEISTMQNFTPNNSHRFLESTR